MRLSSVVHFCARVCSLCPLQSHHKHEDELFFPFFEEQLGKVWTAVSTQLSADHAALHAKLETTRAKLVALDPVTVTWEQLRELVADFTAIQTLLLPHVSTFRDCYVTCSC